ncbi:NADH:flavin oxidoreductase/NADH oxidase [Peniophora sp. CONT]|nr:NADH:flavin oxidoreductase/NADH oxidase [Peniophora sp. CONT]
MSTEAQEIPTLFKPTKIGNIPLSHRVVLAPLTRFRADDNSVHTDLAVEYYRQRSSTPGTFLITEATIIAPQAAGYPNVPGIWNDDQVAAWKKIADVVHGNASFIFMQLWAVGRVAISAELQKYGFDVVGPSAIALDGDHATPRALTVEEIKEYLRLYAQAAKNAIRAGFDGVEVHSANGYLLDEFLQSNSNHRTDEYGGSVENRIRFTVEVVDAIAAAIGPARTSARFSPWSRYQAMRMLDPVPTFSALVRRLAETQPQLAYLHIVEPRVNGEADATELGDESNDFIKGIWAPRPLIVAGGFDLDAALQTSERDQNVLVAMGRYFISNPDLPRRWKEGFTLTPYERQYFYSSGSRGYTDYTPFSDFTSTIKAA